MGGWMDVDKGLVTNKKGLIFGTIHDTVTIIGSFGCS